MQEKDNLVLIILSGIPCSLKSTWAESRVEYFFEKYNSAPVIIISKDAIRLAKFGKGYSPDRKAEKLVDDEFFKQLGIAATFKSAVIILDNTHCKESFLDNYMSVFRGMFLNGKMEVYIKFFDVPLWKAQLRNIWRYLRTGKYVPYSMMKILNRNFNRIDREKYKHLISHDF